MSNLFAITISRNCCDIKFFCYVKGRNKYDFRHFKDFSEIKFKYVKSLNIN